MLVSIRTAMQIVVMKLIQLGMWQPESGTSDPGSSTLLDISNETTRSSQ